MSATEQDRERARDLLFPELADEMPHNLSRLQFSDESAGQIDRIAAALADERERARAPFLALAAELERESEHSGPAKGAAYRIAAARIRRAAEESQ